MPLAPVCAAACWYCSAYRCARCCAGCGHPANCCACFGWRSGCGFCCRAASRYPSGSRAARPPFNRLAPWFRRSPCPRNSRRRLCRARQAVLPCPAACLTSGWHWQRSGLPGLWFCWCVRRLAIAACAAWWSLPAKRRMAATPAPPLPRRSHLACCAPAFICRKACRVPHAVRYCCMNAPTSAGVTPLPSRCTIWPPACTGGTRWRGWRSANLRNTWNLPVTKPPSAPLPLPNALITAKAFCALPRCARCPVPSPLGRARWPSGWPTC